MLGSNHKEPKRSSTLMAPSFFTKLVKGSPTTPTNPADSSFSVNKSRNSSPNRGSRRKRAPSLPSSVSAGSEASNPEVLVIPPSPSPVARPELNSRGSSPNLVARPLSAHDPGLPTPTPDRPGFSIRHSSSLTNLRNNNNRSPSPSGEQNKRSHHPRAATDSGFGISPPGIIVDDGSSSVLGGMQTIVESPGATRTEFLPGPRTHSLLAPTTTDDAQSVYSVSSGKKKSPWKRSAREAPSDPGTASLPATPVKSNDTPKRKPTGIAAAIAASGMAIANPTVSTQHANGSLTGAQPNTTLRTPRRSASISSIGDRNTGAEPGGRHDISAQHAPRPSLEMADVPMNGMSRHSRVLSVSSHDSQNGDDTADESGSEDELDLDDDIPVTGFAVASTRRNYEFHEMFTNIPEGDYLIEDYGCALARDILVQGRLYISENHLCFHANIFGWVTDLVIPMHDVISLEKKMTAIIIPNAILVSTRTAKYTFASFMARDTTFDVIFNVWRLARPQGASAAQSTEDVSNVAVGNDAPNVSEGRVGMAAGSAPKTKVKKVTQCACGKNGEHYTAAVPMDIVVPGTPEQIYNLMFASGFIKDFMRDNQKLMDIQISDWVPDPATKLLSRNMSYIKPLNGSIGPKETKCELKDETAHFDVDDYISSLTTTRTPNVPSGTVFAVKTRTCLTWASALTTRVHVTTQVDWTGRSFIKGIIEKSCIDGQKTYHDALDKAMRAYIHEHRAEFIPEGIEADAVEASAEAETPAVEHPPGGGLGGDGSDPGKARERERNQRSLQWAYDTFAGAMKVARTSTEGALDLIMDAWDQSSGSTLLWFVIILLVLSNVWTLAMMGRREEAGRRKGLRAAEERERLVQGVVAGLWGEMAGTRNGSPIGLPAPRPAGDWHGEVEALNSALDAIQERLTAMRQSIAAAHIPEKAFVDAAASKAHVDL